MKNKARVKIEIVTVNGRKVARVVKPEVKKKEKEKPAE